MLNKKQNGIISCASVIIAVLIMGWILISCGSADYNTLSNPVENSGSSKVNNPTMIGQNGFLSVGKGDVIVGTSEDAERKLSDASASQDYDEWAKLVMAGDAYMVSDHTKCKLIGFGSGIMGFAVDRVRIESGEYKSEEGWVPMEFFTTK